MKNRLAALAAAISLSATVLATVSNAEARCVRSCRTVPWVYSHWGYGGLTRGGWGLGGIAEVPWVGGSIIAVTPYGPYPYGPYTTPLNP